MQLPVIIQEAKRKTGLLESATGYTINSAEVFKGGSTFDAGEKKAKVEALSRGGVSMVHPAYGKGGWSSNSPPVCPVIPYHLGGEILIENVSVGL